jgi:hypothetical protein
MCGLAVALGSLERRSQSTLPDDAEGDIRGQVEQKDSNLVYGHARVAKDFELLVGQAEPPAVEALNPAVRRHEDQEPQKQDSIVDD